MEHAMKMGAIAAAILCAVAAGRDAQAEQKFQRLTGAQIQAKFAIVSVPLRSKTSPQSGAQIRAKIARMEVITSTGATSMNAMEA
jgi:hypothetical protein